MQVEARSQTQVSFLSNSLLFFFPGVEMGGSMMQWPSVVAKWKDGEAKSLKYLVISGSLPSILLRSEEICRGHGDMAIDFLIDSL